MYLLKKKKSDNPLPWFTVHFDSSSGLVSALKNALYGKPSGGMEGVPQNRLLARLINGLPRKLELAIYKHGSASKAIPEDRLHKVNAPDYSRWVVQGYPRRKYPVIALGSSNGAVVHLCAAMGIPWLPQTFLIPVRTPKHLTVDDPISRMEWAGGAAKALLGANPDLQLHHMMDPNQDRPMLPSISYFRVKALHLDEWYQQFIAEHLEEGGTLLTIECNKTWPVVKVDERHYFQFGGLGGTTIKEYFEGSPGVEQFLQEQGAGTKKWNAPQPDAEAPESEWGFIPTMLDSVRRLAKEKGYKVQRLVFEEPEEPSPVIAELYRTYYKKQGVSVNRLLAGTFALMAPYLSLRTGSVPYWLPFNARPSVEYLKTYLQQTGSYDEVFLMPFSNGIKGQGLATHKDYQSIFRLAKNGGEYIGADPDVYPFDFGIYARYELDLQERLKERFHFSTPLTVEDISAFLDQTRLPTPVRLLQDKS